MTRTIPETLRGNVRLRREVVPARDGLVALRQSFAGEGVRVVVTHGASLLARVCVERGRVSFPLASGEIDAPPVFLLALPPRSVLPMAFHDALVESTGVGAFAPCLSTGPALLRAVHDAMPVDLAGVREAARAERVADLDADRNVAPAIKRARTALHDALAIAAPVRAASRAAGVAPETLSRLFTRVYALGPKEYCHRARLFEGTLRLLSGKQIAETAFATGWGDLSRFYTQFRRVLRATPGVYTIKKRQDPAAVDDL